MKSIPAATMLSQIFLAVLTIDLVNAVKRPINPGYDVEKVKQQMLSLAAHSWEWGTASQALLELESPELSVFGSPFPIPSHPSGSSLDYARQHIYLNGSYLVKSDGAVGDPASLGVSALLIGKTEQVFLDAAERQKDYLFAAPKWANGAISHRIEVAELWADFIYMGPPFLAFYGAFKNDESILRESVRQVGLYREVLIKTSGFWTHIIGPRTGDPGSWSTGNAWAAAGAARVLATVMKSPMSKGWKADINELKGYIKEILDAVMISGLKENGLLRNYLDDASWFGEVSGTALLSAVAYRMHVIDSKMFGKTYRDWADAGRATIAGCVDADGILGPAINPLSWGDRSPVYTGSPEGNSFAILLAAAYRDCVLAGKCK